MMNELVNPPSWRNDTVLPLPPQVRADAVAVDAACCAGVSPASHKNALEAMKVCQITIENE